MADGAAWDQGWNLGSRIAEQGHARKLQLSDEDRNQKAHLLGSQLENLRTKIQSLPKDSPEYQQTFDAMQDTLKNVKELFRPDTHPGLIASHGHLITDALGLTNAKDRQGKQERKDFAAKEDIEKQAQNLVPVSSEQEAQTKYNAQVNAQLSAIEKSGMSDADKEEAKRAIFRIYQNPNYVWLDLPDGSTQMFDKNDPGAFPPGAKPHVNATVANEELAEYQKYVAGGGTDPINTWKSKQRESSAALQQWVRATYGKDLFALSPEDASAAVARYKSLTTPTNKSTGETLVYDQNNQPHIFTHTSTSSKSFPGAKGGTTSPSTPPSVADPQSGTSATPKTQPRVAAPNTTAPKAPKSPIGPAIDGFTKLSPEVTTARKDVIAATKIDSLANQALASHEAVQQRQLALAMIRGMAGRVNMQEFQQYTTKMGVENTVDGLIKGIESGQLPDGVMQELANAAHANLKASQDALKTALQSSGVGPDSGQGSNLTDDEFLLKVK